MDIRRSIIYAGAFLAVATPTMAAADIIVETAPPPIVSETAPPERPGYVWSPGYQKWQDGQYSWVPGHWVQAQVHSHWVSDKWDKIDDTHWRFSPGHWEQE